MYCIYRGYIKRELSNRPSAVNLMANNTFLLWLFPGTLGDEILGEISRDSALRGDSLGGGSKKRKAKTGKGKKKGGKKRKFH